MTGWRNRPTAEQELAGEVEMSHECLLFQIDPQNSYVMDDFNARDTEFWNRRARQ